MVLSTNFTTWVDGPASPSIPGASDLNRLQDNDRFLSLPPMAIAYRGNSDQAVAHSTQTPVRFDTEIVDTDNMFFNGTSTAHIITINTRGYYQIDGSVVWDSPPNNAQPVGWRALRVRANDSFDIARVDQPPMPQPGLGGGQQISQLHPCPAGMTLQLILMHSQGTTITISGGPPYGARFSARWVAQF